MTILSLITSKIICFSFTIDSRFEGYKLKSLDGIKCTIIPLLIPVSIDEKSSMSLELPYKLIESRARFNHLFSNPFDTDAVFFIDASYNLMTTRLESTQIELVYKNSGLFNSSLKSSHYPSIIFPSKDTLVYNDGHSQLFILEYSTNNWVIKQVSTFETPFQMINCVKNASLLSILGYHTQSNVGEAVVSTRQSKINFNTILYKLNDASKELDLVLQTTSTTGPLFSLINQSGNASFIIGSEYPNEIKSSDQESKSFKLKEKESPCDIHPEFQYNWTQTDKDITLYIQIAKPHEKRFVNVRYTNNYVHVSLLFPEPIVLLNLKNTLYASILPLESIWTLDQPNRITLYMQKKESLKWPSVFEMMDEVKETQDEAIVNQWKIKMNDIMNQDEKTDESMGIVCDKNEEIDFEGQSVCFARFERIEDSSVKTDLNYANGHEFMCTNQNQICLGHDVDGIVYSVNDTMSFKHTSTFSAMNFVKNSKIEKQFMTFGRDCFIVVEMKRYVFVYFKEMIGVERGEQVMIDLYEFEPEAINFDSIIGVQHIGASLVLLRNTSVVVLNLGSSVNQMSK